MSGELQPLNEYEGLRRIWDESTQRWWFAVVDVVGLLSEATDPSRYWADMKRRDKSGQLLAICEKFPMKSPKNNRTYQTECANQEGILRIVQSIPSPKAEPFKQWLAKTGSRRLDEIQADPLEAERERYRLLGYDEDWINARIGSIATRNQLTDEWQQRGVQGREYGILTNEIHKGTFDNMSVKAHKEYKGVQKGNLRDHMTPLELAFTILGEASTIEEAKAADAQGFDENKNAAVKGGKNAGVARKSFEEASGRPVISNKSYLEMRKKLEAGEDPDDEPPF
ncbi:MAG: phage antirepressor protein [Ardenticatenaceae bacterium]|nr:phage antirepressor protein [Ardenticatenaceae bacterium]